MKAIIAEQAYTNLSDMLKNLKVVEIPRPSVRINEVLVEMEGAPCNPSDIAFLRGMYNISKDFPTVPGFEGAGTVIDGKGVGKSLLGKRVCFFKRDNSEGTWAEYVVVNAKDVIELSHEFPPDQAPVFFVNPFTAFGLIEKAILLKAKAIIQNAASGQVGHFVRVLAKIYNIPVINIVRRPIHIEKLNAEGECFILNSRDKNFENQLAEYISLLKPNVAFDAVAGDFTAILLKAMPVASNIIIYGGLSGLPVNLDVLKVIFENKTITGFNLNYWFDNADEKKLNSTSDFLQSLVIEGSIKTEIQKIIQFEEAYEGLYQYLTKMSDGKVILKP